MVDLGTLGGISSEASAINDLGEVVGSSTTASGDTHAFSYTPATGMVDLGTISDGSGHYLAYAADISNNGEIVGRTSVGKDSDYHAFSYTPAGGMVDLGSGGAAAVNDAGQVVGGGSGHVAGGLGAFSYTPAGGRVALPPLPNDWTNTWASDVNAGGQIVGGAYWSGDVGGSVPHAVMWTWVSMQPQTITFTSSPPSNAVYGGSYTASATGGDSGNPVVLSIDSSSTPWACRISGAASTAATVSFTGVGSCVIDANQGGNSDYLPAAQAQQTLSVGKATLTVTADDKSKPFGASVPPLTATITGFVTGETLGTSGVIGSPLCTTTATATSPAGTYPITCTAGTLSAAHYVFTFTAGTLTVTFSQVVTGPVTGPLTVTSGHALLLGPGATVTGPLTVQPGGALEIDGATIRDAFHAKGAVEVRACGATFGGSTTVTASTGLVMFGDNTASCAGNTFTAQVSITKNIAGVIFDRNTVTAALTITGNTGTLPTPHCGTVEAIGNTVTGNSTIQRAGC